MRLTHLVQRGGCASKLGPTQLTGVLAAIPRDAHPSLLVGFDHRDDAGVFRLSESQALVQTIDYFTPIVDDPYAYGQIAAANALSDVYAMGGRPLTVLNVACFDPEAAPAEVWSQVLKGMYDKTVEAGAVVMGGHSVEDKEPKFGMSVTGVVDPNRMFANTEAKVGDQITLTKPLGTGIVTTAAKFDDCDPEDLAAAIASMSRLNATAMESGHRAGSRCATDITGFSLAGHLTNIARASKVRIRLNAESLPTLPGLQGMVERGNVTGGARKNRAFVGDDFVAHPDVDEFWSHVAFDPQTSGGLALFSREPADEGWLIGEVVAGEPGIELA